MVATGKCNHVATNNAAEPANHTPSQRVATCGRPWAMATYRRTSSTSTIGVATMINIAGRRIPDPRTAHMIAPDDGADQ